MRVSLRQALGTHVVAMPNMEAGQRFFTPLDCRYFSRRMVNCALAKITSAPTQVKRSGT